MPFKPSSRLALWDCNLIHLLPPPQACEMVVHRCPRPRYFTRISGRFTRHGWMFAPSWPKRLKRSSPPLRNRDHTIFKANSIMMRLLPSVLLGSTVSVLPVTTESLNVRQSVSTAIFKSKPSKGQDTEHRRSPNETYEIEGCSYTT